VCYNYLHSTTTAKGDSAMIKRLFKNMQDAFIKAQEQRVAYWQLNNLTDSNLKDMGIHRSEIRRIVYGK
jgi:uncharacterized protein YjiS (DUF1127 family)